MLEVHGGITRGGNIEGADSRIAHSYIGSETKPVYL